MRIIIGGGGTGGHIYPALALARYLKEAESGAEILFVGTARGLESKIVPAAGYPIRQIDASGFQRNIKSLGRAGRDLYRGLRQAARIVREYNPHVVLGTGGYVAAPLVLAAALKGYPVVLHEQNALPGMTNRRLAPYAKRIGLSFSESAEHFPARAKTVFTGNPRATEAALADREEGYRLTGLKERDQILLVYGGSGGAEMINKVVTTIVRETLLPENIKLIFVTGERYYNLVCSELKEIPPSVKIYPYLENMPAVMAAADLVLTRSGATTLAEITALGIPSILVPSPNVVDNHQYYNARLLSTRNAAVLIEEQDLDPRVLSARISELINNSGCLAKMSEASKILGVPDAAKRLYDVLKEVCRP